MKKKYLKELRGIVKATRGIDSAIMKIKLSKEKEFIIKNTSGITAEIVKHIDDEFIGEEFDQMLNKIFIGGKRYGPFPYLRSTMKVGKHENLKPKQQPTPNFWGTLGEKTEEEIEREEEQKQANEEEQKRFADSFKLFPDAEEE